MTAAIPALAVLLLPALLALWVSRNRKAADYTGRHIATPAEVASRVRADAEARVEAERAIARREAQVRFDAEGAPRYVYDVAVDR